MGIAVQSLVDMMRSIFDKIACRGYHDAYDRNKNN